MSKQIEAYTSSGLHKERRAVALDLDTWDHLRRVAKINGQSQRGCINKMLNELYPKKKLIALEKEMSY